NSQPPVTLGEIKCFMGLNILMGIKKMPSYKDYWSARIDLRDHFIASCMSRNRFSWLLGHIHVNDNTLQPKKGHPGYDKLLRPIELVGKHHEVYIDNFFNSVELQLSLQNDGIYICGTVRPVRKGFPKDLAGDKQMNRGDSDWRVSDTGIVAAKWKDNKPVHFLSNFHNPEDQQRICTNDYNAHMGYVDKCDMYKSCYEIDQRAATGGKSLSLKEFRLAVANGLIGADPEVLQRGRRSNGEIINKFKVQVPLERRTDKASHMPVHGTKVRCAKCNTRKDPHRTRWHCSSCNVGLCLQDKKNCFADFHKK
ncbi:hypothetical protein NQ317_000610, partial [Molorchus minor]